MRHLALILILSFFSSGVLAAEATSPEYSETYRDMNCAAADEAVDTCKSQSNNRTLSFEIYLPDGRLAKKNCAFMISLSQGCVRKDSNGCSSEKEAYTKAESERGIACKKVGGCDGGAFLRCEAFLETEDVEDFDEEASSPIDKIALVQACPFYAKGEKEAKDLEIKNLDEEITTEEDRLQELTDKMKKDLEDSEKTQGDMQTEIAKLDAEAQNSYSTLQTELSAIDQSGTEAVGKIRRAIEELKSSIQLKSITENGEAVVNYQKVLTEIEQKCYQFGLDAARAEGQRVKKGTSGNEALSIADKGIIQHLREKANAAYRQCQNSRMFKGNADAANQLYTDKQRVLRLNISKTQENIAALQAEFKSLPSNMEQDKRAALEKHMAAAQSATLESQSKKGTLQQLMRISQQNQMQMQQQMMQLQTEQMKRSKTLRALKMDLSKIKRASTTTADADKFAEAQGANEAWKFAKIARHHACCPNGSPLRGEIQKNVCLSKAEKSEWDVEDDVPETQASPAGVTREK